MSGPFAVRLFGALAAPEHAQLLDQYSALDALLQQVISDLQSLMRQGYDVDALNRRYELYADQLTTLRGDIETLDSGDVGSWEQQAAAIEAGLSKLLDDTISARSRAAEGLQYRGLAWGLGAASVAVLGAWFVWRGRKRRRRR